MNDPPDPPDSTDPAEEPEPPPEEGAPPPRSLAEPKPAGHRIDPEAIARTRSEFLGGVLRRERVPWEDVPDLRQEVLVVVLRCGGSFTGGPGDVDPWLTTIARHQADNYRRAAANRLRSPDAKVEDLEGIERLTPERLAAAREQVALVQTALGKLRPKHREILVLAMDGASSEELADRYRISSGAARGRVHQAREAFDVALGLGVRRKSATFFLLVGGVLVVGLLVASETIDPFHAVAAAYRRWTSRQPPTRYCMTTCASTEPAPRPPPP